IEDYVRTAHAKGLAAQVVIRRHAFRNALVPVLAVLGIYFGQLLGGAAVAEMVFARPGLGKLLVDAILLRDYPLSQALITVFLGAPLALAVGVVSVAIGSILGSVQGLVAGYVRGSVGTFIMAFTDAMLAFPTLLLALAVMATLGPGLANVMIAVGVSTMPRFT